MNLSQRVSKKIVARALLAWTRATAQPRHMLLALVLGLTCVGVPVAALYETGKIGCPSWRTRPYSVAEVRAAFQREGLRPRIDPTPARLDRGIVVLRAPVGDARLTASICPRRSCGAPEGDAMIVPDPANRASVAALNLWIASGGEAGADARRADHLWDRIFKALYPPVPDRCNVK